MKKFVAFSLLAIGVAVIAVRIAAAQTPEAAAPAQPRETIEVPADPNAPVPVPDPT